MKKLTHSKKKKNSQPNFFDQKRKFGKTLATQTIKSPKTVFYRFQIKKASQGG